MSEDIKQQWVWNPLNSLSPITVQTPQNHSEIPWPTTHAEQQTYGVSQQCDTIKILLYCSLDYLILANSYITPISLYQFLQHFNHPLFSYYLGVPSSLLSQTTETQCIQQNYACKVFLVHLEKNGWQLGYTSHSTASCSQDILLFWASLRLHKTGSSPKPRRIFSRLCRGVGQTFSTYLSLPSTSTI